MEDNFYYLGYYQVMSLMYAIDQLKKSNQSFSDEILENFEKYVVNRTSEIATYSPIKLKIKPSASKYAVSKSVIEYLIRLTGVNIFDKNILKKYTQLVKEFEHNLEIEALNGLLDNNLKKGYKK